MQTSLRLAAILALLPALALAGHTKPPTPVPVPPSATPDYSSSATAASDASADAAARAAAIAQQRQAMVANLQAQGGNATTGPSTSGSTSGSDVQVGGDSTSVNARAWALTVPGLVAAPAVITQCLRHSRGWGAASAGATGGTFYDEECRKGVERAQQRQECFAMADRLALWGRPDAAVEQLTACGAVVVLPLPTIPPSVIPPPAAPPADYVPRQEFEQRLRDEREIRERMFKRGMGK